MTDEKEDVVVFGYVHDILGPVGTLEMYPFKKGEMKRLLEDAGLKVVEIYSDLAKEKEYRKIYGEEPPDFFTYVAIKQ